MNTAPMISVIVPVYGAEKYLRQCAKSILRTEEEIELILVDDGSEDGSGAICDEFAGKDARVRAVHRKNGGLVSAWKRGVKESRGQFLVFVDSDDWIDPEMLPAFAGEARKTPKEEREGLVVCCGFAVEKEGKSPTFHTSRLAAGTYEGERLEHDVREEILGHEERTVILSRCMKLISRPLIEQNLSFADERLSMGEDVSIMVPALLDARRVVLLPDAYWYHYRTVESSMVHAFDPKLCGKISLLRDAIGKILREKKVPGAEEMTEKEFFFLLFLEYKNQLRRTDAGTREICRALEKLEEQEHVSVLAEKYGGEVRDPADRLILPLMKKPGKMKTALLHRVFLAKG